MSSSLFDRARMLTKGLFGPKKSKPRLPRKVTSRLTLEVLEDRNLLSAMGGGGEPMFSTAEVQSGRDAAQQAMSYLSGYESTVAAMQQRVINLEQQTLGTISRVESSVVREIQQFIQQSLFPNSTENSPSVQPASPGPDQAEGQNSIGQTSGDQPVGTTVILPLSAGGISPDDSGGPTGYSPSQIENAYGFNQIGFASYTGSTLPGAGQTIAIVDPYDQPNIKGDLQAFDSYYGIPAPPSFNVVNQTGGSTLPAGDVATGTEESLDVEWAHAIAPGANILLVEAAPFDMASLMVAVNYAANQPGVSVVSMSWGQQDFSGETSYDSDLTTPSNHNGVTFVAASGDNGSNPAYDPIYPSTSPNALAVGGTMLTLNSSGGYGSETGWSGSGGGISANEPLPSYQPGTYHNGSTEYTSTMRTVPDVALSATNYSFYDTYGSEYTGWVNGWVGTSFATPVWAALVAIADQGRALNNEGTLDGPSQTLPAIYQMPSSNFHDITTGNNGSYSAGPGYDLVTGIGTPIANSVINSLVSYDASSWQPVSLSSYYNETGISDGTAFSGTGLDNSGYELGTPGKLGWQGGLFPYGPANAPDVVSANGQAIDLPAGAYTNLTIFATAVGAQTNQPFTVEYTNGTQQTFTLSLSNWTSVPGQYSDEIRAEELSQYNSSGTNTGTTVYDSGYALPLITNLTVKSITLPDNPDIDVLGMLLA